MKYQTHTILLLGGLSALSLPARAHDASSSAGTNVAAGNAAKASDGILPVPDYSGSFWTRNKLIGDWGGFRNDLANKGVQVGVEWNQYGQGVTSGGRDESAQYGGGLDYTLNLDLMRMGVMPGALVRFRAESRYGRSVNGTAGPILPVNTDALFPLTRQLDQDIGFAITDLNYVQFLSQHFGLFLGKLDTLAADQNEFASGRGTSQFMNANFVFNPSVALRLPYSTLGVGAVWMPAPVGTNGGITIHSSIINTEDSSTSSGFDDFGDGQTWTTEADFQYRFGQLPGGMNVGILYSFNQHFNKLNSRLTLQAGQGLAIPQENSTWAAYWSAWQYVFVKESSDRPIDVSNGEPDEKGVGLFARFGFADQDTNPVKWALSGGVGGRGLIPSRDNDTYGIGGYYNSIQTTQLFGILGLKDSTTGFECFYNVAVTPACHITLDLQVVDGTQTSINTATILGLRASFNF